MSATVDEPECRDCGETITLAEAPTMKPCKRCGYYMHLECGMGLEGELDEWCENCLDKRAGEYVRAHAGAN